MSSQSCTFLAQLPTPPTTLPSCAVPIGGSNSSILDTCCNGHINAIATYAAPGETTECYQYCVTKAPETVRSCLAEKMAVYEQEAGFECFNTLGVERAKSEDDSEDAYESAAVRRGSGMSWVMGIVLGISVVGSVVGCL